MTRNRASSNRAMILPVRLRRVASGLIIDKVRSIAIRQLAFPVVKSAALYTPRASASIATLSGRARALPAARWPVLSPGAMLTVADLTYRIAGRALLENTSLTLPDGHHAGLVGRNGTGKSTLLKLIAGDLHADAGTVTLPTRARIGMLAQEAPDGPESLLDTVLAADQELSGLLAEAESASDPPPTAEIYTRLADIGAHPHTAPSARLLPRPAVHS